MSSTTTKKISIRSLPVVPVVRSWPEHFKVSTVRTKTDEMREWLSDVREAIAADKAAKLVASPDCHVPSDA